MSSETVKKPMAAIAPFGLRMQPDLKERIERAAAENGRSMNAEIIYRLQTTPEMDDYVPKENAHPEEPPSLRELIERMNDLQRQIMDYTKNIR